MKEGSRKQAEQVVILENEHYLKATFFSPKKNDQLVLTIRATEQSEFAYLWSVFLQFSGFKDSVHSQVLRLRYIHPRQLLPFF